MERVCFRLRVRPEMLDEYRERHRDVWPEMRQVLREAGWRNYSIFTDADGIVIGYLECDDFAAAQEAMAATQTNARWQRSVAHLFEGAQRADEGLVRLEEVFHLD